MILLLISSILAVMPIDDWPAFDFSKDWIKRPRDTGILGETGILGRSGMLGETEILRRSGMLGESGILGGSIPENVYDACSAYYRSLQMYSNMASNERSLEAAAYNCALEKTYKNSLGIPPRALAASLPETFPANYLSSLSGVLAPDYSTRLPPVYQTALPAIYQTALPPVYQTALPASLPTSLPMPGVLAAPYGF